MDRGTNILPILLSVSPDLDFDNSTAQEEAIPLFRLVFGSVAGGISGFSVVIPVILMVLWN